MRPFLNTLGSLFSSEIVRLVPQSDDYSCPVCTDLAYKPSRTPNLSRVIMYFESNLLIQSYSSSKMWSHLLHSLRHPPPATQKPSMSNVPPGHCHGRRFVQHRFWTHAISANILSNWGEAETTGQRKRGGQGTFQYRLGGKESSTPMPCSTCELLTWFVEGLSNRTVRLDRKILVEVGVVYPRNWTIWSKSVQIGRRNGHNSEIASNNCVPASEQVRVAPIPRASHTRTWIPRFATDSISYQGSLWSSTNTVGNFTLGESCWISRSGLAPFKFRSYSSRS